MNGVYKNTEYYMGVDVPLVFFARLAASSLAWLAYKFAISNFSSKYKYLCDGSIIGNIILSL